MARLVRDVLEHVGRFNCVYRNGLGGATDVQGECLPGVTEDIEGTLVQLLKGPPDTVDSEEDMEAAIEVLAGDDCCSFRRARLLRQKSHQGL